MCFDHCEGHRTLGQPCGVCRGRGGVHMPDCPMTAAVPDPRFRDQLANPVDALLRGVVQALWDTERAQVVIAADLGISQKHLSMIRQGRAEPSLPLLRDMCRVLQVEARVQAAANQRAAEGLSTDLTWLSEWVNAGNAHRDPEAVLWSRVLKVSEEVGEVYEALSGAVGENPRKGFTHSMDDVQDELLDVASAALCAVEHLRSHDGRAVHLLAERVDRTVARARADAFASPAPAPHVTAGSEAGA